MIRSITFQEYCPQHKSKFAGDRYKARCAISVKFRGLSGLPVAAFFRVTKLCEDGPLRIEMKVPAECEEESKERCRPGVERNVDCVRDCRVRVHGGEVRRRGIFPNGEACSDIEPDEGCAPKANWLRLSFKMDAV